MATKIPRQAFIGLAALAWADGMVERIERQALLRAAKECGLDGDDFDAVEWATENQVTLERFEAGALDPYQRVLTYSLATWLVQIDGVVSSSEATLLATFGERLALDKPVRDRAQAAAFDIAVLPGGGKPEKYDFVKLEARLREKLPHLGQSTPAS